MQLSGIFHRTDEQRRRQKVQQNMQTKHELANAIGVGLVTVGVKVGMGSIKSDLSFEQVDLVSKDIIKTHKLDKKGLTHIYLDKNNEKHAVDKAVEGILNHKQYKHVGKEAAERSAMSLVQTVKKGLNAFYMKASNFAVTAKNKAYLMPHELGHAVNANSGKTLNKIILNTKNLRVIAPSVLFFNALHNDVNDKDDSKLKKTRNFLERNADKLTFLSFVPLLAEEGLASAHGIKHAKKVLGKKKIGTFLKSYGVGYASYLGAAITASVAMHLAMQEKKKVN